MTNTPSVLIHLLRIVPLLAIVAGTNAQALDRTQGVKTLPNYVNLDINNNQNWAGNGLTGMYMFDADNSATSTPLNNWAHIIEMQHDGGNNWTAQIAVDYFGGGLFWRQQYGGNWAQYSGNNGWQEAASKSWVQAQLGNSGASQWTTSGSNISYSIGNIGIGTSAPQSRLHIVTAGTQLNAPNAPYTGDMIIQANTGGRNTTQGTSLEFVLPANTDGSNYWGQARIMALAGNQNNGDATGKLVLGTRRAPNGTWIYGNDITIDGSGNVGIGTNNTNDPTYKLFVETGIRTRKLKVDQATWPDYVFDTAAYKLAPLSDVEYFIQKNGHLRDIPSAQEIQKGGIDIGENQAKLLQKIEELTLYAVAQYKLQKQQEDRIDSQDKKMGSQDKLIAEQAKILLKLQKKFDELEERIKKIK